MIVVLKIYHRHHLISPQTEKETEQQQDMIAITQISAQNFSVLIRLDRFTASKIIIFGKNKVRQVKQKPTKPQTKVRQFLNDIRRRHNKP